MLLDRALADVFACEPRPTWNARYTIIIQERSKMELFAILRLDAWADGAALEQAAARSTEVGDGMPDDIRWIRSYVLSESGGSLGTVCIYEASSADAIQKHAAAADLPVTGIIAIADTVIVRPDPD